MDRHQQNRVLFVEFDRYGPIVVDVRLRRHGNHRGDPTGQEYDVTEIYYADWCKRDECHYVEQTGFGPAVRPSPSMSYWAAPGQDVDEREGARRLKRLRRGWPQERLLDLCEHEDTRCYYCETCDDWLPENAPCDHVESCAVCGYPILPDDEGEHFECREELKAEAEASKEAVGA